MAEQVYRVVQYGVETTVGTSVPATAKLAVDAATPELDRGSAFGAEDYGRSIRNHAGRGYHGLRGAQMPFSGDVTFEQLAVFLETHYAGGITATASTVAVTSSSVANPSVITTGSAHGLSTGDTTTIAGHSGSTPSINGSHVVTVISSTTFSIPVNVTVGGTGGTATTRERTRVYPFEGGTSTRKTLTIEEGVPSSTQDEWEMAGCLVDDLTLEYDALAAPGAQPWRMSGTFMGMNRVVATLTPSLTLPDLETVMGHLTILKDGTTSTAFASLSEIAASLVRFSVTTNRSNVRRAYGSTSDVATGWGQSEKAAGTFEAMLKVSATTKTNVLDIWNASGGALGERRWRISAAGSGTKALNLDFRTGFTQVGIDDRDGERVYAVSGELIDDDTLASMITATIVNNVA